VTAASAYLLSCDFDWKVVLSPELRQSRVRLFGLMF